MIILAIPSDLALAINRLHELQRAFAVKVSSDYHQHATLHDGDVPQLATNVFHEVMGGWPSCGLKQPSV